MENTTAFDSKVFESKSGYDTEVEHDFVMEKELTVTITLSEYRKLLKASAKAKVDEYARTNYDLRQEIEKLKKEVATLERLVANKSEKEQNNC